MRTFPLRDSPLGGKRTPHTSQQQASQSQRQPHGSHICAPEWAKPLMMGVRPLYERRLAGRQLAYVGCCGSGFTFLTVPTTVQSCVQYTTTSSAGA